MLSVTLAALAPPSSSPPATRPAWALRARDRSLEQSLARQLSLHPVLARLLAARGLHSPDEAQQFLYPRLATLTPPEAMADRAAAADRLARAVRAREPIALFGDYDVDGTTSAALLTGVLRALGGDARPMVASRFEGGYGLSQAAAEKLTELGTRLLVTLDCGTSDHERIRWLTARGVDVIVVDHHKVPEEPLPALAFLNAHRPDCGFAYKGLASVGMALSLAAAVRAQVGVALDMRAWLDLVAVGTIADVAPLTGDNRTLVRAGLERLAQNQGRPGLRALLREARLRSKLRAQDVAFSVAPMINAAGRMGPATPALQLLLAESEAEAGRLARALGELNDQRRKVSAAVVEQALAQVPQVYGAHLPAGLVVAAEGWHHGVGGIVAGRLVERFGRPVAVLCLDGEHGVGSVRGPKGWSLFACVQGCAEVLEQFGGHEGAAGLRVRASKLEALRERFAEQCALRAPSSDDAETLQVDTEVTAEELGGTLAGQLSLLEPTGHEQPEPLCLLRGLRVSDVRPVGPTHLRGRAALGKVSLGLFLRDGVGRRERGEWTLREGAHVDAVGHLRPDAFAGEQALQLEVRHLAAAE